MRLPANNKFNQISPLKIYRIIPNKEINLTGSINNKKYKKLILQQLALFEIAMKNKKL